MGSDTMDNMATYCRKCHEDIHRGKLKVRK
jgi:ribosomal protein L40E